MQANPLTRSLRAWSRQIWWNAIRPSHRILQERGLGMPESIVLRALQRGPLTVAEAGEYLALSHSAASRAVDRLVEMGLVERTESPQDRRCRRLTLSSQAEDLISQLDSTFSQAVQPMLERLTPAEQAALNRILLKMVDA